jgi:hypothetical protein
VSVALPGVTLDGQTVACLPLADIEARMGRAVDGILGYDFISRFVVEIDYLGRTLTLYERDGFTYEGDGAVVPITLDGNTPQVRAAVTPSGRDPIEANFLIDTGAGATVAFTRPFAEAHDLASSFAKSFEFIGGFGVGGESRSTVGRLSALTLGDLSFADPVCALAHDEGGALADPHIAGLIGGLILRRCTVFFDYERLHMILEPNADYGDPFEADWSGLILKTGGRGAFHDFTVVRALPGSPAEAAGIESGDVLVSADGVPAAQLTVHSLWSSFQTPGTTVELEFKRGDDTVKASLELRRRL